jgi:methionine synthase I (cobalamin-dependent)
MALQEIKTDLELTKRLSMRGVLLGAYANCLTPVAPDWSLQESDGPQPMRNDLDPGRYYSEFVKVWVQDFNVQLIGGCCGITPEHINFLREKLQRGANEKHL